MVTAAGASYEHNGQGQRVKKDNGTTTLFAYGEGGNLIGEYDASGTVQSERVWFNNLPVSVLKDSIVYAVHTDHLGTPRVITDAFGTVWTWINDPFESTPAQEYTDANNNLFVYNLRFPGQYFDTETGFHYNYFRTYDPSTGRYLESNPIGLEGGPNTYGYVGGNPISYVERRPRKIGQRFKWMYLRTAARHLKVHFRLRSS